MGDHELLAERFEEYRIRLRAVAYRMLVEAFTWARASTWRLSGSG
jgi:hypothetical protein